MTGRKKIYFLTHIIMENKELIYYPVLDIAREKALEIEQKIKE
ncbi:MAG: hypothetical protein WCG25_01450 [bacterium]